jgi:hypothetical protein
MDKVASPSSSPHCYSSQSSPPVAPAHIDRNGLRLTLDRDAACKLNSSFFIKVRSHKRYREHFTFGLPAPKRIAAGAQAIPQPSQKPDAGSKMYAPVTIQILQHYLNIAVGLKRCSEIAVDRFMTAHNLDPTDSIYFSLRSLAPEGRKFLAWLEHAEFAKHLPDEARHDFFTSTARLTAVHDGTKALLIGARNLECALAWYCLPEAKKMTIMDFCVANNLSYSSMQKHFWGGGMLHPDTDRRIARRYGNDTEYVMSKARQALRNDYEHAYISATGKVTPEWKALLLGCHFDGAMKRLHSMPITPPQSSSNAAVYAVSDNGIPSFSPHQTL